MPFLDQYETNNSHTKNFRQEFHASCQSFSANMAKRTKNYHRQASLKRAKVTRKTEGNLLSKLWAEIKFVSRKNYDLSVIRRRPGKWHFTWPRGVFNCRSIRLGTKKRQESDNQIKLGTNWNSRSFVRLFNLANTSPAKREQNMWSSDE